MTAYGPGQGPGPKPVGEDDLARLLGEQQFAVLATTKKSGHPHLSTVVYTWDPAERIVVVAEGEGLFSGTADELREAVETGAAAGAPGDSTARRADDLETSFLDFLRARGH